MKFITFLHKKIPLFLVGFCFGERWGKIF